MSTRNYDEFGTRMKLYESVSDIKLMSRCPVIIRLDGHRFSKLTKKLPKPSYDFLNFMANAMLLTIPQIDGCVFGYTQSDEFTFVLKNDQSYDSLPWFGNRVQKMASLSASILTQVVTSEYYKLSTDHPLRVIWDKITPKFHFDSRVYVVPDEMEMYNALYWRQLDCIKNAISMVAEYRLREKLGKKTALNLLHGKGRAARLELLKSECNIDFFKGYPVSFQRGTAAYKEEYEMELGDPKNPTKIFTTRTRFILDKNIPNFHDDNSLIMNAYNPELKGL